MIRMSRSALLGIWALVGVSALLLSGTTAEADAGPVPFERALDSGFPVDRSPWFRRPFDILATDMDLDGDPDLLINWHHHEPLELYENEGGRLVHRNPLGADRSGLYDNRGIPYLFERPGVMQQRIEASGRSGLYVWHDRNRGGSWRFLWKDDPERFGGLHLRLETSLPIVEISDLETGEIERTDERHLRISLKKGRTQRPFGVRVRRVATQLVLQLESTPEEGVPPIFVGSQLTPMAPGEVELWKPDPHGIAWVDVAGSPEPELFITRGGLGGELMAPARPKEDRYYLPDGGDETQYRRARKGIVPGSYGRGRRVEWVDVDGDGRLDLSISSEKIANSLLVRDATTGVFHDRAADWGLDLENAAVQTWGDLDTDGRPDLFYLDGNQVHVMQNRTKMKFERVQGEAIGLVLPSADRGLGVIDPTSLQLSDFDNDGDLDLWVLVYGRERAIVLFRNDGKRFANVSHELGVDAAQGGRVVVLVDVDNDGFDDAVSFGQRSFLWTNLRGRRFRADPFPKKAEPGRIFAATSCDIDGDGRIDLVAAGKRRRLLSNTSDKENGFLDVVLKTTEGEPVGALVRVRYSDGSIRAQRYGSSHSSAYSQALGPLHFGIRKDVSLQKVGVQWPGDGSETLYDAPETGTRMVIVR
jgi:hypothetical protein